MRKPKSDYSIQTVVNAFRLVEAFRDREELGVTELSKLLDLHKNNVFRLLATLEQLGYVAQTADGGRYRLDTRCLELGRAFRRAGGGLVKGGRAAIERLVDEVGETAHLAVLRDLEVVHLDGQQPRRMLVPDTRVGDRLPPHCTALGKALLGCGDEQLRMEFDRSVAAAGALPALTPSTIVDRDKFIEHLRGVSVRGFALDLGECEAGLFCVAAPVYDARSHVVAALSISAPAARTSEESLVSELAPRVVEAGERLSLELGYDQA